MNSFIDSSTATTCPAATRSPTADMQRRQRARHGGAHRVAASGRARARRRIPLDRERDRDPPLEPAMAEKQTLRIDRGMGLRALSADEHGPLARAAFANDDIGGGALADHAQETGMGLDADQRRRLRDRQRQMRAGDATGRGEQPEAG